LPLEVEKIYPEWHQVLSWASLPRNKKIFSMEAREISVRRQGRH
jgi:hypothetical protein